MPNDIVFSLKMPVFIAEIYVSMCDTDDLFVRI